MSSNPWLAGAIGFGAGAFAAYLLSQGQTEECKCGKECKCSKCGKAASASAALPAAPALPARAPPTPSPAIVAMNNKQSIYDVKDWENKRVLIRVDYNVKIKKGVVGDKTRIEATLDTLKLVLSKKPKAIILCSHLGRPQPGAPNFDRAEFTLEPVAKALQDYLPTNKVVFLPETVGPRVEQAVAECAPGTIFLLENLRYHAEETGIRFAAPDTAGAPLKKVKIPFSEKAAFRAALSKVADIFVFEAFGASHRPHSSIIGIDCPTRCSGLLMYRELSTFGKVLGAPERPFLAIIGGAKVSDKITMLENLIDMCDEIIIGGGMAYTFKKTIDGMAIGNSLFDEPGAKIVQRIVDKAKAKGVLLHLPVDHIIADKFAPDAKVGVTDDKNGIPAGWMGLDIGPLSRARNSAAIGRAKTIIWNGPLGVFEMGPFAAGTLSAMYDIVTATKERGVTTVCGGGDTGSAAKMFYALGTKQVADQLTHLSTGGGASLALMEGKMLPGVQYMSNKGETTGNPPNEATEPVDEGDD